MATVLPRQFQHASKPPIGASLFTPLCITISPLWAGRTAAVGLFSISWLSTQHTGASVFVKHIPLTLLKCTLTRRRLSLAIALHLGLPLTLGPVNAGDQQSRTLPRHREGNGVLLCDTPFVLKGGSMCGNAPQLETKCTRRRRRRVHKKGTRPRVKSWDEREEHTRLKVSRKLFPFLSSEGV